MNVFNLKAAIGIDTAEYEKELQKSHGLAESFGSKLGSVFSSMASTVGNLMSDAATKVSGFLTDAAKTGADFDTAMSQVAATMGKSVDEIGELRDFAMKMGQETAFSASEAAEALNYLALAGYDAQTQMGMLPKVLDLAAAGSMGLADASNLLAGSLSAFGFDVTTEQGLERANHLIDEMAQTAKTTQTDISQLGSALTTVGALATELNGGFVKMSDGTMEAVDGVTELQTALGLMANKYIKASEAGTHMRNMLMKMTSNPDEIKEALGVDIFDEATGKMRSMRDIFMDLSKALMAQDQDVRLANISKLFNTRDTAALEAVLTSVATDWDRIGEGLVKSEGAAEKMKEAQLDNLAGDMKLLESAVESFKIKVSDQFSPVLRRVVQDATDFVAGLNIPEMAASISEFFDPLLDYFEIFQTNGLGQTLTAIGWDIDAFARKIERFDLKELFDSADFSGFTDNLQKIGEIGSRLVSAIGTAIVNNAGAIGDSVIPLLTSLGNALTDTSRFSQYVDMAKGAISNFCDGLLKKENIDLFFSDDKGIPKVLANIATNLGTGISAVITAAGDILGKILGYMVDPANQETIKNGAIKILTALRDSFVNVITALDVTFNNVMKAMAAAFGEQFDGTETGEEIVSKLLHGIWNAWCNYWESKGESLFDWLMGYFVGNEEEFLKAGTDMTYDQYHKMQAQAQKAVEEQSDLGRIAGSAAENAYWHAVETGQVPDYKLGEFAVGGIVTRPTYALIGESGAEAVMPLEHNTGWIRELAQELGGGGQTVIQFGDIYVNGDEDAGHKVAEQIDRALRDLQIQQARGIGGTAWKR